MQIVIHTPYIQELNNRCRLWADIEWDGHTHQLWYETEKKYGSYFVTDLSDSFVVALLLFAMEKGADLLVEGGMSERLHVQLTNNLIPVIAKNISQYSYIPTIYAKKKNITYSSHAVGTGFSCGIDSFYTIYKGLEHSSDSPMRLTHLCFFNAGNNGGNGGKTARKVFNIRREKFKQVASEIGLEFLSVDCNINEFLHQLHVSTHTFRTLSIPLALQKLFKLYYFSSGFPANDFRFDYYDAGTYDLFSIPNLCTQNTQFMLVGSETTRIGKVNYISDYSIVQQHLHVCLDNKNVKVVKNCCKCKKCKRTMLELYLCGKIENFYDSFDVDYFYSHLDSIIRWALRTGSGKKAEPDMPEIIKLLDQKQLISKQNYLIYYLSKPYYWWKRS